MLDSNFLTSSLSLFLRQAILQCAPYVRLPVHGLFCNTVYIALSVLFREILSARLPVRVVRSTVVAAVAKELVSLAPPSWI
jgi:hypothetical protein